MRHADLTGRAQLVSLRDCSNGFSPVGGATHQLLVADCQVRDFSPAHRHHIKAAVRLPAKDPQRVCGPAEQAATVWAETYTPEHTHTGVRGHTTAMCCTLKGQNSPDWSHVSLHGADHRELLQIPQLDGPADTESNRQHENTIAERKH